MSDAAPGRSTRVRAVVLGVLWLDVAAAVVLVVALVRPGGGGGLVLVAAVLAVHALAHGAVLLAAVSPWWEERSRALVGAALVATTALAAPVLAAAAEPGEEPWAWLLGFSVGALAVLRWWAALGTLAAGVVALGLGAGVGPGSIVDGVVFAALGALLAGGLAALVVWMLGLLVRAEEGREAQARLAVAEERLRVARDLHDILSHRLSVIALRAELHGDAESRELADRTLGEVRAAVHGYGTVDLAEQLRGAQLVLGSAGVAVEVTTTAVRLDAGASQLLAAAVREAVTNVLRHSEARRCRITLGHDDGVVRLSVDNDGVDPARPRGAGGTGLSGLSDRARPLGAALRTHQDGTDFTLVVDVPR